MPLRRVGNKTRNFMKNSVFLWFSGVHKNTKSCYSMCRSTKEPGELTRRRWDTAETVHAGRASRTLVGGYPGNGWVVNTVRTSGVPCGTAPGAPQWAYSGVYSGPQWGLQWGLQWSTVWTPENPKSRQDNEISRFSRKFHKIHQNHEISRFFIKKWSKVEA